MAPELQAKLTEFDTVRIDRNGVKNPKPRPSVKKILESEITTDLAVKETLAGLIKLWNDPVLKLSPEDIANNTLKFLNTQASQDEETRSFALDEAMKVTRLTIRKSINFEDSLAFEQHPASRSVVMDAGLTYALPPIQF